MLLSEITQSLELELNAPDREIVRIAKLQDARPTDISFLSNERGLKHIAKTSAGAVFVREAEKSLVPAGVAAIVCPDPYYAFARATAFFTSPLIKHGGRKAYIGKGTEVSDTAKIGQDSSIGANCMIMAGVYIGDEVTIGDDVVLYPNVVIYNRTKIGAHVRIHAGTVVGSDGFGYARGPNGEHIKIRHLGRTVIEDNVEIGANSTIDRASLGETIIRRGTKIDNLVHIAHGCEIGERSLIAAQVGFAGGAKAGKNLVVGGQSGFAGHIEITDNVTVAARSGATKSVKTGGVYAGFPLIDHRKWLKLRAIMMRLLKRAE
ncbi:UDP-3-O-acylglucosamine N-acyltransferase [Campylobacterota bacterium]|nr:UDP-3-O-acylglucosamine N-acyltransferase [Campylobacterota bacterium]